MQVAKITSVQLKIYEQLCGKKINFLKIAQICLEEMQGTLMATNNKLNKCSEIDNNAKLRILWVQLYWPDKVISITVSS